MELRLGYLVKRQKDIVCPKCQQVFNNTVYQEKGTDVNIAVDLLTNAFDNQYDTAILISEDGDFASAVQEVQRLKKKVENTYSRRRHLSQICNKFVLLDKKLINSLN